MAIAKIQNVTVDSATKKKIRDNSPFALPLNPTVQGWSAQHVRDQLFKAICGSIDDSDLNPDETNLLNVFSRRVSIIKEILEELDNRYVDLTSTVLGTRSAIVSIITEEKILFLIKPSFTDDVFVASNLYLVFKDTTNLYVLGMRTAIISLTSPYSTVLVTATKSDLNLEIVKIVDGITTAKKAEQDKEGNVISTHYVSNATLGYGTSNHRIALTLKDGNGAPIVSAIYTELPLATQIADGLMPATDKTKLDDLPNKAQYDLDRNEKVDKTTTILDIPLDNNILLGDFKTALGVAITNASGLMSATDKARLDALHALLGVEADANAVVSTINEVLAIFHAYPEGADLVSALGGKVDKVTGQGLSANDYSDTEKDKVSQAYAHKSLTNNPHAVTFAQLGSKPTTLSGFGITDAYTKAYIDSLKDLNGWESELITSTPLVNSGVVALSVLQVFDCIKLFARNTSTGEIDTDSFDTSLGLVSGYVYKLFDNADITFTIGSPNCTFLTSAGYELSVIGQKYSAQDAENVNFDKTVKNRLEAENVQDAIDEIADEVKLMYNLEDESTNVVGWYLENGGTPTEINQTRAYTDYIEIELDKAYMAFHPWSLICGVVYDENHNRLFDIDPATASISGKYKDLIAVTGSLGYATLLWYSVKIVHPDAKYIRLNVDNTDDLRKMFIVDDGEHTVPTSYIGFGEYVFFNQIFKDGIKNAVSENIEQEIKTRFIKEDAYHNVFVGTTTFGGTIASGTILYNVALGEDALSSMVYTTGDDARYNTAIGSRALRHSTSGNHNTAIGFQCMDFNTIGNYNTALGEDSLYSNTTGSHNTSVGCRAMQNFTTGGHNVAIGTSAMYNSDNTPTGTNNIAIGSNAFSSVTTGSYNVVIGGYSRPSAVTDTYSIVIGNSLKGTKNHQCIIGGSAVETICLYIGGKKRELQFNADGTVTWTEI